MDQVEQAFGQFRYPTSPADVCAHLDAALLLECVFGGELIVFDPAAGRTSFGALQNRVTAGRGLTGLARRRPATWLATPA